MSGSPLDGGALPAGLEVLRAGRLLVANPRLADHNFDRTVVLLLAHSVEGALGVVLNRPSDTTVELPLPRWRDMAASPAVVFMGGPVQPTAVIGLAQVPTPRPTRSGATHPSSPDGVDLEVPGWVPVTEEVGTVDLEVPPDPSAVRGVRVFAGYAGWAAGQLETEVDAGAWWVVDFHADDVLSDEPEQLWKRVLRRQGGALALIAAYPDDPRDN